MCVMSPRKRVGVRELRQNLSVYLRRVLRGEGFEVTHRGHPVAVLGPLPESSTALGRLVAEGRATEPVADLLELGPPCGPVTTEASEALREERGERL